MTESTWREIAEENGLDCTLRKPEIKCALEHVAVCGDEFMPYGWGGRLCCDNCKAMECPDVCEACSYTERYDLREPVLWPCNVETRRLAAEGFAKIYKEREESLAEIRRRRLPE